MKLKVLIVHLFFLFTFPVSAKDRLQIIATIFPLYDFCRQIAAERADVELLLPPGVDIHHFEPRPEQIRKIFRAAFFVFCHRRLEVWANRTVQIRDDQRRVTLEAGAGLEAKSSFSVHKHSAQISFDPHLWLDLELAIKIAERIKIALIKIAPEEKERFEKNFQRLASNLVELDRKFKQQLSRCRQKTIFFAGHNAFQYLARRYQLEFKTIYGLSPDSEASAQKIAFFIRKIKSQKISVLFSEKLFNPQAAQTIVSETGVKLLELNPAATLSRNELQAGRTFLEIMEENLKNLLQGLSCE